jgi:hypothetical protein
MPDGLCGDAWPLNQSRPRQTALPPNSHLAATSREVYTRTYIASRQPKGPSMHFTRVFKSGNSQAVRIPAELAYSEAGTDLQITRLGDVILSFPCERV